MKASNHAPKRTEWLSPFRLAPEAVFAFRIALAAMVLTDLGLRFEDLRLFYTDEGIFPRGLALRAVPDRFSLYLAVGTETGAGVLFLIAGASAILFGLGVAAPWSGVASFLLLVSLQNRNPLVLNEGDVLLRCLHFYALFLPAWNVFGRHGPPRWEHWKAHHRAACTAIVFQLIFMYLFGALWKTGDSWRSGGDALFRALHQETVVWGIGPWIRQWPAPLLALATRSVAWFELLLPYLILMPWRRGRLRLALVTVAMLFHLVMIQGTLRIGIFPWVAACAWIPMLPGWLFNGIGKLAKGRVMPSQEPVAGKVPKVFAQAATKFGAVCLVTLTAAIFLSIASRLRPQWDSSRWAALSREAVAAVGLKQSWKLFAPDTPLSDRWHYVVLTWPDGKRVDYLTGEPPDYRREGLRALAYPSVRWRRLLANLDLHPKESLAISEFSRAILETGGSQPGSPPAAAVALVTAEEEAPLSPVKFRMKWRYQMK